MHQLAIALHRRGYDVSGSEDEIYDPSKRRLASYGLLPEVLGWWPERINKDLDAVILGMHARPGNPELEKALELDIPIFSYPQYMYDQCAEKTRIVVGGSHGKTTITSMLMHVLKDCGKDFDYLVGADVEDFDFRVKLSDAPLAVFEGDEYLASPIHRDPKFLFYKPQLAILTGVAWDHINVFPTYAEYERQFLRFLESLDKGAKVFYCQEDEALCKVVEMAPQGIEMIPYGLPDYWIRSQRYWVGDGHRQWPLRLMGKHNMQNMEAARNICVSLGISNQEFYKSIGRFKGAGRRLQEMASDHGKIVYWDFAHAPSKVAATVKAVREKHPKAIISACFELHTFSSLNSDFIAQYEGSLSGLDRKMVFFNEHTFEVKQMEPLSVEQVQEAFGEEDLEVYTAPEELDKVIRDGAAETEVLLLMSSGNFAGLDISDIANFVVAKKS